MSLREIRQKAVGGIGKMIEVKQKQAVSGGNGSTFRFIVVALLSYTMGYFHGSASALLPEEQHFKQAIHDSLMISPFVKTPLKEYLPNRQTDSYNYFHCYIELFLRDALDPPKDMEDLPMMDIWPTYFEAYQR